MKTILYKIILILLFIVYPINAQNSLLKNYSTYLQSLDINKYYSNSMAANKYKELFSKTDYFLKDSAFVIYEQFYHQIGKRLNEIHVNDKTDYSILFYNLKNDEKFVIPDIILNYRNDLIDNGFDIAISEGNTWIKEDWNFISRNFYSNISQTMKNYCTFLNMVMKEGTLDDGAFIVSPTRIAERIIWLEEFTKSNPRFILTEKCNGFYKYFLYLLLHGSDHSAILGVNDSINKEFQDAYNYITLEYNQTKTATYVTPFYEFLKNKQKSKAYTLLEKYQTEGIIKY